MMMLENQTEFNIVMQFARLLKNNFWANSTTPSFSSNLIPCLVSKNKNARVHWRHKHKSIFLFIVGFSPSSSQYEIIFLYARWSNEGWKKYYEKQWN
jgi:hypothetical protein